MKVLQFLQKHPFFNSDNSLFLRLAKSTRIKIKKFTTLNTHNTNQNNNQYPATGQGPFKRLLGSIRQVEAPGETIRIPQFSEHNSSERVLAIYNIKLYQKIKSITNYFCIFL